MRKRRPELKSSRRKHRRTNTAVERLARLIKGGDHAFGGKIFKVTVEQK
jgi:hypothetical protein